LAETWRDLERVERLADELLECGGVYRPPTPTNLIGFVDLVKPVLIRERTLDSRRLSGVLEPHSDRWEIVVNSAASRAMQRFAVFHEGFHILQRTGALQTDRDRAPEYSEWLANQFAARVLMPRRWVVELAPKARNARHLAGIFYVSEKAMSRRLGELNLKVLGVTRC
jgi:hypothetical protein